LDYRVVCYAKEGEDIILSRLFREKSVGFYVDIGAHHPKRFSNTYLLYCRGWRGINIDAMPGSMKLFQQIRPRDINLEMGVSNETGVREYHVFQEGAVNTFDTKLAQINLNQGWKAQGRIPIVTRTINSILSEYLPPNTQIDLLSIDIEGLDSLVLSSLNFSLYRPGIIICEDLDRNVEEVLSSDMASVLLKEGYYLSSKLLNSCVWKMKTPS